MVSAEIANPVKAKKNVPNVNCLFASIEVWATPVPLSTTFHREMEDVSQAVAKVEIDSEMETA